MFSRKMQYVEKMTSRSTGKYMTGAIGRYSVFKSVRISVSVTLVSLFVSLSLP